MHIRTYMEDQQQSIQSLEPTASVSWSVGWGQIVFVSYRSPHGAVGTGEGVVHEYSLERGWGHDVGRGQRGSQVGNYFFGQSQSFPILIVYDGFLFPETPRIQENP